MQKCLIFLLALFSLTVQARANWNPYVMDYERFVHMSDDEKRQVVIKTMEFMVELESKYKKDIEVSGYSQDRYEKYVKALEKLQNFLISSAVADDAQNAKLLKVAGNFGDLLSKLGSNGCVYGGYVSRMAKTSTGDKYCQHPATVKSLGKNDPEAQLIKDSYLASSGGKPCTGPSKISCNPAIFGFTSATSSDPICVDTGYLKSGKAHNVSYSCMKESLKGDSEGRLNVVVAAMDKNKKAFSDVHGFIFKTCACGGSGIDADYLKYIKPHRTCFGMMNSLREMKSNECAVINDVKPTDFASEWSKYFSKAGNFPDLKPGKDDKFDTDYNSLINKDAVKTICADLNAPEKSKFACEATCEPGEKAATADAAATWICKITKSEYVVTKGSESKVVKTEMEKTEFTVTDKDKSPIAVNTKDGKAETCNFSIKPVEEQPKPKKCTLTISEVKDDLTKVTLTAALEGYAKNDVPAVEWPAGAVRDPKLDKVAVVAKTKEAQKLALPYKVAGHPGEGTCDVEIPALDTPADDGAKYTIEAKAEAPASDTAVTIKVVAVVKLDGKEVTDLKGLQISWNRVGFVTTAPKTEEKPKASTKVQDPVDEKEKENKDKENKDKENKDKNTEGGSEVIAPKPGEEPVKVGTDLTIDEPRTQTVYKACATLLDDKGKKLDGPSCDDISPLKAPTPPPANLNNFPQGGQQGPAPLMAPQNNTRMLGIQ